MRRTAIAAIVLLMGCRGEKADPAMSPLAIGQEVIAYSKDDSGVVYDEVGTKRVDLVEVGTKCTVIDDSKTEGAELRRVRVRAPGHGVVNIRRRDLRPLD